MLGNPQIVFAVLQKSTSLVITDITNGKYNKNNYQMHVNVGNKGQNWKFPFSLLCGEKTVEPVGCIVKRQYKKGHCISFPDSYLVIIVYMGYVVKFPAEVKELPDTKVNHIIIRVFKP